MHVEAAVADLVRRIELAHAELAATQHTQRYFCGVYLRSTLSMQDELSRGGFADPDWVGRLTVAFATAYLDALEAWRDGRPVALPWRLAFDASPELSPLVHELIGLNAHLNFDLPAALLSVTTAADRGDDALVAVRLADFTHIDTVMVRRIPEEYGHLRALGGPVRQEVLARLLYPLNSLASRRWLVAARRSVWHNAGELAAADAAGEVELARRVADLEVLCGAKVADLLRPGQVLLRLAVVGFGVTLPPIGAAARSRPVAEVPSLVGPR